MTRKLSTAGRNGLKRLEACRLRAYRDAVGVLTIGYGHTENVYEGAMLPDEASADALLSVDLAVFEDAVNSTAPDCSQGQFDAMVLLTYNIGVQGFKRSSVLKAHQRGDYQSAARAFALWNQAGGRILPGLVTRRAEEAAMYLQGSAQVEADEGGRAISDPLSGEDIKAQPAPDTNAVDKPLSQSRAANGGIAAAFGTLAATASTVAQFSGSASETIGHLTTIGFPLFWLGMAASILALAGIGYALWARYDDKLRGFK